jgi:hypothetical protein
LISEQLAVEIAEFAEDRKQLAEAKAKYAIAMRENANLVKQFVVAKLSEEISELHEDQKVMANKFAMLEEFVVESLAKEIAEFHEDKKDLAETKVRLVREAKQNFNKVKQDFIKRSATAVSETVGAALTAEITQLKEDIEVARRNDFGRKLFEAFASEYSNSYLNEHTEAAKMLKVVELKDKQLAEAKALAAKAKQLAESVTAEKQQLIESAKREKIMNELITPLSKDQQVIMTDLLESVQTAKLKTAFDKYLPAVIADNTAPKQKTVLSEAKSVTGNREATSHTNSNSKNEVFELARLAGLN